MSDYQQMVPDLSGPYIYLEYKVWTTMSDINIRVLVHRDQIKMFGEERAVVQATWNKLWEHFIGADANGKNIKIVNPTGAFLRHMAEWEGFVNTYNAVANSLKWECVTVNRRA